MSAPKVWLLTILMFQRALGILTGDENVIPLNIFKPVLLERI